MNILDFQKCIVTLACTVLSCNAIGEAAVDKAMLQGKWKSIEQFPNGAKVITTVQFSEDSHFAAQVTVDGSLYMSGDGTWKVSGQSLMWQYDSSSNPAISTGYLDMDDIAYVDSNEVSLVSKLSGKVHFFQRL